MYTTYCLLCTVSLIHIELSIIILLYVHDILLAMYCQPDTHRVEYYHIIICTTYCLLCTVSLIHIELSIIILLYVHDTLLAMYCQPDTHRVEYYHIIICTRHTACYVLSA